MPEKLEDYLIVWKTNLWQRDQHTPDRLQPVLEEHSEHRGTPEAEGPPRRRREGSTRVPLGDKEVTGKGSV